MGQLLIWTCGPVQDFIASARKGRDLWFGSWLLSEVSSSAAVTALEGGAELLLPWAQSREELLRPDFDVPNKVMVRLPEAGPDQAAELGRAMSKAARDRLLDLARQTFDAVERRGRDLFDRGPAHDQVADLLETYWATTAETGDLQADRAYVEGLLAARKAARDFGAPDFARAGVPKDSLDGTRETVTRRLGERQRLQLALGTGERLSGPGLLKRMGHEVAPEDSPGGRISSVSTWAAASWLRPAVDSQGANAVEEAIGDFTRQLGWKARGNHAHRPGLGKVDAHCLYRSRMDELGLDDERWVEAARALRARLELKGEAQPYYAVILADGDHMGALLSRLRGHEQVRSVSRALTAFARKVRKQVFSAVEVLRGEVIYAGGDDVLAFAAVDKVLEVSEALQQAFSEEMEALSRFLPAATVRPTLSVGVCIAHHLVPLRDVLEGARHAEHLAKQRAGRNALAIRLAKRSGSPVDLWMQWGSFEQRALSGLVEGFGGQEGRYPRGLPYELREIATRLSAGRGDRRNSLALEQSELQRILRQKKLDGEVLEGLLTETRSLARLADQLIIARALAGLGVGR